MVYNVYYLDGIVCRSCVQYANNSARAELLARQALAKTQRCLESDVKIEKVVRVKEKK